MALPLTVDLGRSQYSMTLISAGHSLKVRMAKVLCYPAIGRCLSFGLQDRVPSRGYVIDTHSPLITPHTKASLFWGFYESAEIRFINQYLRTDLDVVELGSSLGVVACHIRKKLDEPRRLICVEANPSLVELIKQNLKSNGLDDRVTILNCAIGYNPGDAVAWFNQGASNVDGNLSRNSPTDSSIAVPASTLSGIIADNAISSYTLVSDIEGAEAAILLNDAAALRSCQQIIIELHETSFDGFHLRVEQLRDELVHKHKFDLRVQHGPVCVFER